MSLLTALLVAAGAAAPAAATDAGPICTDRPTKGNAVCTVPAGRVQIESSLAGWSLTKDSGTRTSLLTLGALTVKYGLSSRSDLQVGVTPYAHLTVRKGGQRRRVSGFGDVTVRYKHRLTGDGAKVQAAVIPYVKFPTADDGLGNDRVEGGLAVPLSFALAGPATMTLGPELDWLADSDGHGRHLALVNLVNVALPVAPRVTATGELWTNVNFDPAGTLKQASADVALAFAASNAVQLDGGANLGLTRDTPDVEIYVGASIRY